MIGTNALGTAALTNNERGILISAGSTGNTVGGTTVAARNVISGNTLQGVLIDGAGTNNNTISGNYIGTNAAGNAAVANGQGGIAIANSAANNIIGGTVTGAGNRIARNAGGTAGDGVSVTSATSTGNSILRNEIFLNSGLGIDLIGGRRRECERR